MRRVGDDTLLTWFDADDASPNGGRITGFTVLTGYDGEVTSAHLGSENILIRTSRVGRDDNGGSNVSLFGQNGVADHLDGGDGNDWLYGHSGGDRDRSMVVMGMTSLWRRRETVSMPVTGMTGCLAVRAVT